MNSNLFEFEECKSGQKYQRSLFNMIVIKWRIIAGQELKRDNKFSFYTHETIFEFFFIINPLLYSYLLLLTAQKMLLMSDKTVGKLSLPSGKTYKTLWWTALKLITTHATDWCAINSAAILMIYCHPTWFRIHRDSIRSSYRASFSSL